MEVPLTLSLPQRGREKSCLSREGRERDKDPSLYLSPRGGEREELSLPRGERGQAPSLYLSPRGGERILFYLSRKGRENHLSSPLTGED